MPAWGIVLFRQALESKANGSLADPTTSHSSFLDDPSSTDDNHGWEVSIHHLLFVSSAAGYTVLSAATVWLLWATWRRLHLSKRLGRVGAEPCILVTRAPKTTQQCIKQGRFWPLSPWVVNLNFPAPGLGGSGWSQRAFMLALWPYCNSFHVGQVRLVLELCDLGNLKEFLGRRGFQLGNGMHDMPAIVATALDIARAMLHLHTENIIHSDLKVRPAGTARYGCVLERRLVQYLQLAPRLRLQPSRVLQRPQKVQLRHNW